MCRDFPRRICISSYKLFARAVTPAKHLLDADVKSFPPLDFSHGIRLCYSLRVRSRVRKWQTSFLCSQREIWAVPGYGETGETSASVQKKTLQGVKEGFD